jgi:hypothetical protein
MPIIKIGADPEAFIVDKSGTFFPAHNIVPGTKEHPFKLERGAVQVDGVACEFNIDPVETEDSFVKNIGVVLTQINEIIKKVDKDLSLSWVPIVQFKPLVWDTVPETNKILGCDPDYNINGEVNINPTEKLEGTPLRTAAGHIHIGFLDNLIDNPGDQSHFDDCLYFAKGFHSAGLRTYTPHSKDEYERLNYYGHNGSFRPKKYGVELRAPSNVWVKNEISQRLVFNETRTRFKELSGI